MKTSSTFLMGAALGLLVSLAPACGAAKPMCDASTCSGCCDTAGVCQFGFDNAACGTAGAFCQTCGFATTCQTGLCLPTDHGGGGTGGSGGGSTGGGTGGGSTGGGTGGGVTGGGTGGGVTGGGTGGGVVTGGGTGGGVVTGGGTGGGVVTGGGTGGGGALPSFTSQLWYFGRVSSTTRNEIGRVLFPSRALAPLNVPGTDIRSWSINAAGRLVAMSADATVTSRFDLVVMNHDGSGLRTVAMAPTGSAVTFLRFSPNGNRIMYETRDASTLQRLFVVNTAGGTPLEITPPRATPGDATLNIINTTWSRDSRYLAIVAESTVDRLNELWVVDFSAGSPTPVNILSFATTGSPGTSSFWGVVSPVEWSASAQIIFKYRSTSATPFRLMQISATGTNFMPVPGSPDGINITGYIGAFGVSPAGTDVTFSADTVTQQAYEVYRLPLLAGSSSTRISTGTVSVGQHTDFNRNITSNPNGSSISFGGNYDLSVVQFEPYVLPLPNGPQVRLAVFPTGGNVDDLVWSPDGSQLAFVADWRTDETFELALATSLTGVAAPTPLVTPVAGGDVLDVQWTP